MAARTEAPRAPLATTSAEEKKPRARSGGKSFAKENQASKKRAPSARAPVRPPLFNNCTTPMGSLKKRRKTKINKHKRRKRMRANRHKKRLRYKS